jgi:glycosyltransferase involved in cell wall biosynthesis
VKTIKEKIIIHAVSIHAGGGKVLLDKLLSEKTLGEVTALISDSRYTPPPGVNENLIIYRAEPTLKSRWKAEGLLKSYTNSHPGHVVLCFSNLPPALKLNAKVILYLQNALLLPNVPLYVDSLRSRLRTIYEKIWLQLFWKNIDEVWVQTSWMKEALAGKKTPVVINPIKPTLSSPECHEEKKYDFITVTGSSPHKRLSQLLDAWELMPTPAPSLLIITDWVTRKNEAKLAKLKNKNITVKTVVTRDEIFKLYNQSRCLILTSKVESYCLPIYEALNYNLKIMAPDEKYVKEACTPDVIIDPDNIQEMHWKIENFYNHLSNKTKVLNILNVNMSIDPVAGGGTSERTVQMSKALKEIGHQCSILTLNLGVTESRMNELKGIQVTTLPCLIKRFYIPWPRLSEISNLVKKSDLIHLMGHWTLINVLVYFYIRKFNKKYVVCPAGALPVFGRSQISKKIFNYYIGKKIIQNADAHILVAQSETGHFADYGVTEEKMFWIPNGIDPKLYRAKNDSLFREKFALGESPFILFIGRLNPIKGPDLFIEAFCSLAKQFPDYHVVLAGPDEGMLPQLKKTVSTHQLDNRVHFIGHISGETKSQALHAASLMVIPSRQEAMSIVVLEAGIEKLPVLLTDQCGLNYLDSINAGKVVPATVEGIRNGLSKILSHQDELKTMGENLYQHVIENYLWSSVVAKINSLYEKILKV